MAPTSAADVILMQTSVKTARCYARIIVVSRVVAVVLLLSLASLSADQRISVGPFVPISVWYPASENVDAMRRDFTRVRNAGFNAISTWISWKDGEPRRGAYSLLAIDRVIAVAAETDLKVQVDVLPEPEPSWKTDGTNALAGQFYEYVRRRTAANPTVIDVRYSPGPTLVAQERALVGDAEGSLTPLQARKALWYALAAGGRRFGLMDRGDPVSPAVLALGETAGVITRNPALFGPLEPRRSMPGEVMVSGGDGVFVNILESADAIAVIGINHSMAVRRVTITFPRDLPEAIWQNMEEGHSVDFVLGANGPSLEHTFAPEDVLVLAIRKKVR
jgi:Beta-galactosidase